MKPSNSIDRATTFAFAGNGEQAANILSDLPEAEGASAAAKILSSLCDRATGANTNNYPRFANLFLHESQDFGLIGEDIAIEFRTRIDQLLGKHAELARLKAEKIVSEKIEEADVEEETEKVAAVTVVIPPRRVSQVDAKTRLPANNIPAILSQEECAVDPLTMIGDVRQYFSSVLSQLFQQKNQIVSLESLMNTDETRLSTLRVAVHHLNKRLFTAKYPGHIDSATGQGYQLTTPLPLDAEIWGRLTWYEKVLATKLMIHKGKVVPMNDLKDCMMNKGIGIKPDDLIVRSTVASLRQKIPVVNAPRVGYMIDPLDLPHDIQQELSLDEHSALSILIARMNKIVSPDRIREAINKQRTGTGKQDDDTLLFPIMRELQRKISTYNNQQIQEATAGLMTGKISVYRIIRKRDGFMLTSDITQTDELDFSTRFDPETQAEKLQKFLRGRGGQFVSVHEIAEVLSLPDENSARRLVKILRDQGSTLITAEGVGYYIPSEKHAQDIHPKIANEFTYVQYMLFLAIQKAGTLTREQAMAILTQIHQAIKRADPTDTVLSVTLQTVNKKIGGALPVVHLQRGRKNVVTAVAYRISYTLSEGNTFQTVQDS
jgi:hypothetical protein